jgi:hypothetical protein
MSKLHCVVTNLAHALQHLQVPRVVSVAEVEPRHIHACVNQGRQALFRPTGRAQGAHNLGLARGLHGCCDQI